MSNLVLITGGAGFIGSHLTPKILQAGFKVRILDTLSPQIHGAVPKDLDWLHQDGVEFIRGDVTSRTTLERALDGVHAVVHLAAETGTGQSMYEIARYNEVNTQATALLFDVLVKTEQKTVRRVLLSSSRSVYGEGAYVCASCNHQRVFPGSRQGDVLARAEWEPICPTCQQPLQVVATRETDQVSPASIYAATKYAQEDLVRIGCESMGMDYVIYRLQNVYGERQSLNNPYTGILSIFSTKIRLGSELPLFEDGEESRDFVHVDDVAESLLQGLLIEKAPNTIINVGSGVATSVKEVASELSRAFGFEPKLVITGQYRIGDIRHNVADVSRLKDLLGVTPKISLREGLQRFANWVNQQAVPEDRLEQANNELRARKLMN